MTTTAIPHPKVTALLGRLQQVKPSGSEYLACCPAHDDDHASLTIRRNGDKILLHCHAKCTPEAIVAALGLSMADLFLDEPQAKSNQSKQRSPIVAVYSYHDEQGRLLFQVVRRQDKSFSQRRPDGKGGWIWNMAGVRRVLYRLPELLASDVSAWVFVVEGEKDVDRLHSLGLVATTSPQGAGKWKAEYAPFLAGRRVVLIPDNDQAGRDHMRDAASTLLGVVADLRWLDLPGLPDKGDVSDWLDLGGNVAALCSLADAASRFQLKPSGIPLEYTGPALWRNADHDEPVTVTGHLGGKDGRHYFSVAESQTGIPGDELTVIVGPGEPVTAMAPDLPVILISGRQTRDITAEALQAFETYEQTHPAWPPLFVRDATLVRVVASESRRNTEDKLIEERAKIAALSQPGLVHVLGRVATWRREKTTQDGPIQYDVAVPSAVVIDLAGAGQWPTLPPLLGISYGPTFAEDGHLHQAAGYSARSGLFHTDAVTVGDISPTEANRGAARMLFEEMLIDFPFADNASHTHIMALCLLPFVRDIIAGPTPLHAIDGPTPGTGKGLIGEVACYVARGCELASAPQPHDEAEWGKEITAWLIEGRSHIHLDNINRSLSSGSLASALTQPRWSHRLLGVNKTVDLPIRSVWLATGNNLIFSPEVARRVVYCRLDANEERPDSRSGFRHPNLRSWVREMRPQLVTAACTLINHWFAEGCPFEECRVMGSFEEWTRVMGGILHVNGYEDFLGNADIVATTATTEVEVLRTFINAWADRWDTENVSPDDLITIASHSDTSIQHGGWQGMDLLADVLTAPSEPGRKRQLGHYVSKNRGKVVNVDVKNEARQYKIAPTVHAKGGAIYRLIRTR